MAIRSGRVHFEQPPRTNGAHFVFRVCFFLSSLLSFSPEWFNLHNECGELLWRNTDEVGKGLGVLFELGDVDHASSVSCGGFG